MKTEFFTINSPEYVGLPEEAKTLLRILADSGVLSLDADESNLFRLVKKVHSPNSFSVERVDEGMIFTLMSLRVVQKRTKVISADSLEISFPGMDSNPTPALKYIFGEGVKKKNSVAVHGQSYGISKLRVTQMMAQADTMLKQSKLDKEQFLNLICLMYCAYNDALESSNSQKSISARTMVEALKFLLLNLSAARILRLWAYNMTAEDYKNLGKSFDDTPDVWLDAMFENTETV